MFRVIYVLFPKISERERFLLPISQRILYSFTFTREIISFSRSCRPVCAAHTFLSSFPFILSEQNCTRPFRAASNCARLNNISFLYVRFTSKKQRSYRSIGVNRGPCHLPSMFQRDIRANRERSCTTAKCFFTLCKANDGVNVAISSTNNKR